jgi:RecB family exonuclease
MPNNSILMIPELQFFRYREIAADVAKRVASGDAQAIVASNGVAAAIIAEALAGSPNGAVSLQLPTIESFARALVNDAGEYPRIASDAEQRFAMRSAARLAADRIIDSQALAAMLQRSYRDVRDSGMTLDHFESKVSKLRNRRRGEAMLRAWREYERLIAGVNAVDPADVLLRAASMIGTASIKPQIIAGFYDMTGAQLRIVHALAAAKKLAAIFVPSEEPFAHRFVAKLPETTLVVRSSLEIKSPSASIAQYENKLVELRAICSNVAKLLESGAAPASIGIVARSFEAYDIRLLHRFANERGFDVSTAETIPLTGNRIGRATASLMRMRERNFPRTAVIDLLRDGFRLTRQLSIDDLDAATRRESIAGGTGDALRKVPDYAAAVAEIESFTPAVALNGNDWAKLLQSIVERFRIQTDGDVEAVAAIEAIAAIFARAHAWNRRFDHEAVLDLLGTPALAGSPAGFSRPVIWAGDVMRFRGRTFDHLFVARMQDDVFPQRRTDDPLLPDVDRRMLDLPEIGDGLDEERLLFRLLQDGASTSIHFTLAAGDGVGKMLRPSPLLKHFAIERDPNRRAEILRDFGKVFAEVEDRRPRLSTNIRQLQRIAFAGNGGVFDGYLTLDDAIRERIAKALQSLSPTAIEDFGECPQKFLWKRVLGVRDLDEPELELHVNARDKGRLDHTILERFYRSLDEGDLRERLEALVDEEFDAFEAKVPPFNPVMRAIERRATKRNLQTFVTADLADLQSSGLRPTQFEYAFGPRFENAQHPEAFVITANGVAITIEGRIDRIDESEKRIRVIDYKSGKALRHLDLAKKIERGTRMQLAMYAMAVAEFFGRDVQSVSGAIKPLRRGKDAKFSFDLAAHATSIHETLDQFVAAIVAGRFPAFPGNKDDDSCAFCPVNHSCRTKHDEAESYAVTRAGDARSLLAR